MENQTLYPTICEASNANYVLSNICSLGWNGVVYTAKGLAAFETTVRDINHQFCYGSMDKYLKRIDIIEYHTLTT